MYREISTYTYVFDSQRWEFHKYKSKKPTNTKIIGVSHSHWIESLHTALVAFKAHMTRWVSISISHTRRFQQIYILTHTRARPCQIQTNDTARSVRVFFRCRFALPKQLLCCARHRNDDEVNARLFHVNGFIYIHCGVYRWDIVVGLSECVCMCARVYIFCHLCVLLNIDESMYSLERLGLHAMEWGKKPIHSMLTWMSKRYGVRRFSVSGSSIGFSCLYKPNAQVNKTL